jgi:CBS domain containing-hemolysin-like protein
MQKDVESHMGSSLIVAIYIISVTFLAALSAALTSLGVLSLRRAEDDAGGDWLHRRAVEDPVHTGVALGIARAAAMLAVVVSAVAMVHAAGPVGAGVFAAASLLLPTFAARALALEGAGSLLRVVRPIAIPVVYFLRPIAILGSKLLGRASPALPRLFAFEVIPLAEKMELLAPTGEDTAEEELIISSIADFGETRVRDVMVPRIDVVAVDVKSPREDVLAIVVDGGHSRIPVYEGSIDRIIGTLHTQDLLVKVLSGEEFAIRTLARDAFFVPESKLISELLAEFKVRRTHLAIVVDEYGGTAGIVTLEDVIEELVGDIRDEFDSEEELVHRLDRHTAVVSGRVRIEELNEMLGLDLPDDVADTLGGLLYHQIGHVPRVGERWAHRAVEFEIQAVERQRVVRVLARGLASVEPVAREDSA